MQTRSGSRKDGPSTVNDSPDQADVSPSSNKAQTPSPDSAFQNSGEGATTTLARFAVEAPTDRIPAELTTRLRQFFLDWIGVAANAATYAESSVSIDAAIRRLDPEPGPATVLGGSKGYSWLYAALLNGCYAHSLDYDDTNMIEVGHPGAPVIAALVSEAERIDATAADFFAAMAVGYEITCRLGAGLTTDSYDRGFHITSVAGIFGAVAAVARLRGLSAEVTESAFGLALSKAAGSMQYLENGSWNKRLHPGFAAHDALLCTALAEAGVRGAAKAFEGTFGLLHAYSGKQNPNALTDGLGEDWVAWFTAIKPYPSCRHTHGSIDIALRLREQVPEAERLNATIEISIAPATIPIVGEDRPEKRAPKNSVDAQFSIFFQFAAAWLDGEVTWDSYTRLNDPSLAAVMKSISVKGDPSLPPAAAIVKIDCSGKTLSDTVIKPLGEPENWIGEGGVRKKFEQLAAPIYGQELTFRIADRVLKLEPASSIRNLITLLRKDRSNDDGQSTNLLKTAAGNNSTRS